MNFTDFAGINNSDSCVPPETWLTSSMDEILILDAAISGRLLFLSFS